MPRLARTLGLALATALFGIGGAHAADYAFDPDHTHAWFEIGHMGTSTNRARFDGMRGTIAFDRAAHTGRVDATIPVNTVSSGSKQFDQHLMGQDLFDAGRYPDMRFVSDRFVFSGDAVTQVPGQLTLRGQTHPVTLTARRFNCYQSPMLHKEVCGGDFEATIDRSRWGLNAYLNMGIPKEVHLLIQVEAARQ